MVQASFNDIVASAHLDTNVNVKKASSSSHLEVKTHVFQQGSVDKTDRTLAEVMAKAQNFPPSVAKDLAYPYAVSLADYRTLKLPSDSFNAIDIENQRQVLQDLARKRFDFMSRANDIDYILAHPSEAEGKAHFDEFRKDPKWIAAKDASEKEAGGSLTTKVESVYMKPTDYSPIR